MENTKKSVFSKFKIDKADSKSRLLTRSLLWMSFGLIGIILVAFLSSSIKPFYDFVAEISYGPLWTIPWVVSFVLIWVLYFMARSKRVNLIFTSLVYFLFAFVEGIFVTSILIFSNGNANLFKDMLLCMLAPAGVFLIMGVLGYFNLINFTKLIPFVSFGFLALLIMSVILFVFNNWVFEILYLYIAALVFIIWIGIDLQIISRTENVALTMDKKEINRMSFMFGVRLFVDFVNVLTIFIQIFRRI